MDKLREKSDKELSRIEKELLRIYRQNEAHIAEQWDKYMARAAKRTEKLENALKMAIKSGNPDEIAKAKEKLRKKQESVTKGSEKFRVMAQETAERISDVNQIAVSYVNGKMPKVYAINYNETAKEVERDAKSIKVNVLFNLVDERTVRNLVTKENMLFPQKVIDKAKDMKWNLKAITSQVTQGIMLGESIPKISKRLENVTDMNKAAAVRNARTMCTAAENSGRLSGMREADEQGIVYEKQWMATHDGRTRESHQMLDGVSIPLDDEFLPNLMYPADPDGDPEEVYNCRCSMVRNLIGFRRDNGSISEVGDIERYEPTYFDEEE